MKQTSSAGRTRQALIYEELYDIRHMRHFRQLGYKNRIDLLRAWSVRLYTKLGVEN